MEFYVNENTFKERLKLFFIKNQRSSEQGRGQGPRGQQCWAGRRGMSLSQGACAGQGRGAEEGLCQ